MKDKAVDKIEEILVSLYRNIVNDKSDILKQKHFIKAKKEICQVVCEELNELEKFICGSEKPKHILDECISAIKKLFGEKE